MTYRKLAALAALLVFEAGIAAIGARGEATPSGEPPDPSVSVMHSPWPRPDLAQITDADRDRLASASELVDFNKEMFAGAYPSKDAVIVVATSDLGEVVAREALEEVPGVRVVRGDLSVERANEIGLDLYRASPQLAKKLWVWTVDPAAGTLRIGVMQELSDDDISLLRETASAKGIAIDVYVDPDATRVEADSRLEDPSPFAGGFRYVTADGATSSAAAPYSCTGGFGFAVAGTRYMLTAGHCSERGSDFTFMWNTEDSACCIKKTYGGHRSYTSYDSDGSYRVGQDDQFHGDVGLINVTTAGKDVGASIWWGGVDATEKIPVTSRRAPTLNDPLCINGAVSGSDCGVVVVDVNTTCVYGGGDILVNADRAFSSSAADCSQHGDSGGSVIYNHSGAETEAVAEGIVNGHSSDSSGCYQLFTGVEEAIQAWGGNVRFGG